MDSGSTGRESSDCNQHITTTGFSPHQEGKIEKEFCKLEFGIRKSFRYHSKRKRFFENMHNIINSLIVISGSAAFFAIWNPESDVAKWLIGMVTLCTALDLVFDLAKKATLHDDLKRRFALLLKDISLAVKNENELKRLEVERILIEADEPTPLRVLDMMCHNEEAFAQGYGDEHIYELGFRGYLQHLWSFDSFKPKSCAQIAAKKAAKMNKKEK